LTQCAPSWAVQALTVSGMGRTRRYRGPTRLIPSWSPRAMPWLHGALLSAVMLAVQATGVRGRGTCPSGRGGHGDGEMRQRADLACMTEVTAGGSACGCVVCGCCPTPTPRTHTQTHRHTSTLARRNCAHIKRGEGTTQESRQSRLRRCPSAGRCAQRRRQRQAHLQSRKRCPRLTRPLRTTQTRVRLQTAMRQPLRWIRTRRSI
jgi:hypothetical protein